MIVAGSYGEFKGFCKGGEIELKSGANRALVGLKLSSNQAQIGAGSGSFSGLLVDTW
jgi:hypothetical protein